VPTIAFVGLGSNLADPVRQLARGVAAIARLPRTRLVAASSLYRSAPVGVLARQPDYVNAVAMVETALRPEALLAALRAIERGHRRRRAARNAPRSLDLDLLLFGAQRRQGRHLLLPHPRLHLRAFVLRPLVELAPDIVVPGRGRARRFLPRTKTQRLHRLAQLPTP
jgi:2-amino-4-hydroxy-6-hydroxymethyldihydropteridine diphosphokinase